MKVRIASLFLVGLTALGLTTATAVEHADAANTSHSVVVKDSKANGLKANGL